MTTATATFAKGTTMDREIESHTLPLVTIITPAYNEAAILQKNLQTLSEYLQTLENRFRFELVIINDGSADSTAELADEFANGKENVRVYHHFKNGGLGQAFKTGFAHSNGDYVVTMDIDLSYGPEHIVRLLDKITQTKAKMVLASPYMKGGSLTNVPWLRKTLSIWANRFLSIFAHGHLSTLTCMVRAYEGEFVRAMSVRATSMEIMPEMIYKSMILRGLVEQIPAHLDWGEQVTAGGLRKSSMRILSHMIGTMLSGFLFRPFMFFILPGLLLLAFSAYVNVWMLIHFFEAYLGPAQAYDSGRAAAAVALAYQTSPHTFIVGLLSMMLSVQLIGLGILALQSKQYFEDLFYLGSSIRGRQLKG